MNIAALATDYNRDGYVSGVPILSTEEAQQHRSAWSHEVDIRAFSDTAWWNS